MAGKWPGIPAVQSDKDLAATVRALVEIVQLLIGQTGTAETTAVTVDRLDEVNARLDALEA